jgi:hypothetical protein
MKSKLYLTGLIIISLMVFSCSNDDYENSEVQNGNSKLISKEVLKSNLNEEVLDSTSIMGSKIIETDGEPINPKPRR